MGQETVLVVDDLEVNRRLFGTWLRAAGFGVAEAASGREALDRVAALMPDLVVLDVHLPDLNGLEVCQRIKADPALQGVPVLQISAATSVIEDRIEALEGGADAYVSTPVPAGEFLAVARSLLRLHSAQAETRVAHERWELAFRDASIGMLLVDGRTERAQRANPAFAALVGRTPEEVTVLDWHEVVHPDDQPAAEARLTTLLRGEPAEPEFELRWLRPDGSPVWSLMSAVALPGPADSVSILVYAHDLTTRRRIEEEREAARAAAEAATRARSEFVARISHEFRTPLNALLGFAQLLDLDDLTAGQKEGVEHILRAGHQLADLVSEVLAE